MSTDFNVFFSKFHADTVNGFSFHPFLPMAASSSGHRRFEVPDDENEGLQLTGISSNPVVLLSLLAIPFVSSLYSVIPFPFCIIAIWVYGVCMSHGML